MNSIECQLHFKISTWVLSYHGSIADLENNKASNQSDKVEICYIIHHQRLSLGRDTEESYLETNELLFGEATAVDEFHLFDERTFSAFSRTCKKNI